MDFFKVLRTISTAIGWVEVGAGAIKGKDKLDAAMTIATMTIPAVTAILTPDEVKNAKIQEALQGYINATVALKNAIKSETGKDLKL